MGILKAILMIPVYAICLIVALIFSLGKYVLFFASAFLVAIFGLTRDESKRNERYR